MYLAGSFVKKLRAASPSRSADASVTPRFLPRIQLKSINFTDMNKIQLQNSRQQGFTLMEIVVATMIFASTVTLMLGLFNYTLKINRRVQGLRQVSQGTRNFTESLAREIRNGQIDYSARDGNCDAGNYASTDNKSLGVINSAGEHVCFYYRKEDQSLYISKSSPNTSINEPINPVHFTIDNDSFHFYVRPVTNPKDQPYSGVQPFVSVTAVFSVQLNSGEPILTIPYQTTISTDVYDIPHAE